MMVPTLQVLFIMLALKVTLFCDVEGLLQVIDTDVVHDGLHVGKDSISARCIFVIHCLDFKGHCTREM